jgi:hypothetical protein
MYFLIAILLLIILRLFVKREGFTDIELIDWWPAEKESIEKAKNYKEEEKH